MIRVLQLQLLCIALAFFAVTGCSNPEQKKEKHYSRAMEYLEIEDAKSAIIELRNAIQIDPKFANARYQLGLLHLQNQDPRAAFNELQRAANLDPNNLDAGVKVAEFYLMASKRDESLAMLEKVLAVNPDYTDGLVLLANIELIQGNFDAAEEAINKATADGSKSDRFSNLRGRIYASQEKWQEAEKLFTEAIDLAPDKFTNYRTLLMFYQQQERTEDARNILQKTIATFPDNPQVYLLEANFYRGHKEFELAEKALLKAVSLEPDKEPIHLTLVDLYKKQNNFAKAEEYLTKLIVDMPDSNDIKATLADVKFDLKKREEANSLAEEILIISPSHGGANFVKAKLALAENKLRDAVDTFSSLTNNYPKWSEPQYFLALSHLRLGQIELAQQANHKALQLSPANSRYHTLLSRILLTQGFSQEAGKEASIAMRLDSRNVTAAKLLAKALLADRKFDNAVELLTTLHKSLPKDVEIIGSLGLAYLGKKEQDKAIETFSQLLDIAPENTQGLALLVALTTKEDNKAAIDMVNAQIVKAPKASGHHLLLGDLLQKNKQTNEALKAYATAQELAPNNPQPYIYRARLMHALGMTEEAIKEFESLLTAQPQSIQAHLGIATLYEAQKEFAPAREHYTKVLDIQPNQPVAANNLAYISASEEGGDLGEALRLAMVAKQARPDDPAVADTLGMVHLKREAFGLAIGQFQLALTVRPDDPTINYHMALAQHANQNKEQAIASLQKALASEDPFGEKKEAESLLQQLQNK